MVLQILVQIATPTHHAKYSQVTAAKMSRNAFAELHTLVMVSTAEWAQHAIKTVQMDPSAGMDNVDVSIKKSIFE